MDEWSGTGNTIVLYLLALGFIAFGAFWVAVLVHLVAVSHSV